MTAPDPLRVAITPPEQFFQLGVDGRRAMFERIAGAGLDGVFYADHVSFRGGAGADGLILLSAFTQLHPTLEAQIGVYLLPLRHPVLVARQLATLSELAPGRIVVGIGVGGEDRREIEACEVDPTTRGRRCDESLAVLRRLLTGAEVTHHGEFFHLDAVRILPAPDPAIPLVIGGRSEAAVRRAARAGDGWLGTWCSARRFGEVMAQCTEEAERAGRVVTRWRHGLQTWVGLGRSRDEARQAVKSGMERFYRIPFEAFERYTPYGSPAEVAESLAPFAALGVRQFNLTPCARPHEDVVGWTGEVKVELARALGGG